MQNSEENRRDFLKEIKRKVLKLLTYTIIYKQWGQHMTRTFIFTEPFRKCWAAMGLHDEELKLLEDILLENPQKGDVIEGTSGARKMRIQMNGHGKRGGGRVIYVDIFEKEKLYFLFAYPKNVQVNLTEQQKKIVRQMVEAIKGE